MHMTDSIIIARHLLDRYGLANVSLTRLGGADNTNYRVNSGMEAYALHLYISARYDRRAIDSELVWLERLQADTKLELPQPVRSLDGHHVTTLITPDGETLSTLMHWVEGRVPPLVTYMTDAQLAAVGAVMARLHAHARTFEPPEGFKRETYDFSLFHRRFKVLLNVFEDAGLDGVDGFSEDAEHVLERFGCFKPSPESFGMIHGDFHSGNYLVHGAEVRVIDFGRCGFGFYLFDLALALIELEENKRPVFLQGYGTVSPLPEGSDDLHIFLCLAYLDNLGFLAQNPNEVPFVVKDFSLIAEAFGKAAESIE